MSPSLSPAAAGPLASTTALTVKLTSRVSDLVRDLVGDLDLEPVVAFGERRQRHGLAALQLMARREVELRRQRLRVEGLRIRLVEELLGRAAGFCVEVVLDA